MANITCGDIGVDMNKINFSNLFNGLSYTAKPKLYMVEYSDAADLFLGKGFEYKKGAVPVDGTVTRYGSFYNGELYVAIDKFKAEATDIVKVARTASLFDDAKFIVKALAGDDKFDGGDGNDVMYGFGGRDILAGNGGNDTLMGGQGVDGIGGGMGSDFLYGNAGRDVFIYTETVESDANAYDSIMDFQKGFDTINLHYIDANALQSGNQAFKWVGAASSAVGTGGELGFQFMNGNTYVVGDVNGDLMGDLIIEIKGTVYLTAADFTL